MLEQALLFALGDGEPPTEIRLFAIGETETVKGKFTLDQAGLDSIMSHFQSRGLDRLPFDYGHGMISPSGNDSHKAAGWFVPEARADGLYATDIQWTEAALEALKAREYRFFSPAIKFDKSRRLRELTNVALLNLPATNGQKPLVLGASGDEEKKKMDVLLSALDASDEAGAVAALTEIKGFKSEILSAFGVDSAAGAVEKYEEAVKAAADMTAELSAIKLEQATAKRDAAVTELLSANKLLPAQADFAKSLSDEHFAAFAETLSALPISKKIEEPEPKAKSGPVEGAEFNVEDYL